MAETRTIYVPRDAAALSVGADEVAAALEREVRSAHADARIIRTGSRGAFWLEPLVEVKVEGRRIGYGPVQTEDVPGLLQSGLLEGRDGPHCIGPVDEFPFLANQERLTFARCGVIDPLALDDYRKNGGLAGLEKALKTTPEDIVAEVSRSGLRGRGGAGFPAGIKWKTALEQPGTEKYICCNADEGDSGTFADRMMMEGDPFAVLEGMIIAGICIGAGKGLVYIRSEYPHAIRTMADAVRVLEESGLLGDDILGTGKAFEVEIRRGAGSYICGEESAMLDSLEGKRGMVRAKPPIPAIAGLFGKPTLVHNVLTLAALPFILANGGEAYRSYGMGRSRGTQPFQLAGNIRHGGLVEKAFGITLRELIEDFGGGTFTGQPVRAVQVGGPLGAYLPADQLDVEMDYEAFAAIGAMVGHGGIVVFDDSVDMARQAEFAMQFCAAESCGKCTPCRIGSVRGAEIIGRIRNGENAATQIALLEDLCEIMTDGSLCAMGGLTPAPVLSALKYFVEDFDRTAGRATASPPGGTP
jgi:formate dehydrogenase iron-sulfur subunit